MSPASADTSFTEQFHGWSPVRKKQFCEQFADLPGTLRLCSDRQAGHSPLKTALPSSAAAPVVGNPNPAPFDPSGTLKCNLFLRRDRSDVFGFISPCLPDSLVPGASFSLTKDRIGNTLGVSTQALIGYRFATDVAVPGGEYLNVSPTVLFNGTLGEPFKKTERSAVRAAIDLEAQYITDTFSHSFDVAPYGQTDFRGRAAMAGLDATYEITNPVFDEGRLPLGGLYPKAIPERQLALYYFRVLPEADFIHVYDPGLTSFTKGTTHAFLGSTFQVRSILFNNYPEAGPICGRIFVNGTAQYFYDTASDRVVHNYMAEAGFFLGDGVAKYWQGCAKPGKDGKIPEPTDGATSTSLSFLYSAGTDKTTLVRQDQYKVQLNYRY